MTLDFCQYPIRQYFLTPFGRLQTQMDIFFQLRSSSFSCGRINKLPTLMVRAHFRLNGHCVTLVHLFHQIFLDICIFPFSLPYSNTLLTTKAHHYCLWRSITTPRKVVHTSSHLSLTTHTHTDADLQHEPSFMCSFNMLYHLVTHVCERHPSQHPSFERCSVYYHTLVVYRLVWGQVTEPARQEPPAAGS